ncbi:glycosyltransferase family A protein [Prevotella sp. P5-64]|uniref:glycosyltransferase family A protein n=1 Tax=Prevotella sp. P5-64 TaxID=2024226 RepID=UPI000B960D79|nr:glycosyltransferase family A protein [Prevotella sp. P5-64]OYP66553.1 hypothetical protein CIK87_10820 [Prevotella sp. P5-64]
MQISVIIPTYKPQSYLIDCLNSLAIQSIGVENFEIVLVLNGCKEPYDSFIKDWIKDNPTININYIQTDKPGVSNARNIALDEARGEFICFIDDDDYVSKTYLQELHDQASIACISLCHPSAFWHGGGIKDEYRIEKEYYRGKRLNINTLLGAKKFFAGPCMKLLHRDIIGDKRFNTAFKTGEDSLFMFSISDKINKVSFTSENAIYYRRYREGSATTSNRSRREKILNSLRAIREYILINRKGNYPFVFFITRLLAEVKCIFMDTLGIKR